MNPKFLLTKFIIIFIGAMLSVINAQSNWLLTVSLQTLADTYNYSSFRYTEGKINFYYSGMGNWTISLLRPLKETQADTNERFSNIYLSPFTNSNNIDNAFSPLPTNTYVRLPISLYFKNKGEYIYGLSINMRKSNKNIFEFGSIGYVVIKNPLHNNHRNPLSYGLGIGKYFLRKSLISWIYYHSYSIIVEDYKPPKLITIGLNYKIYRDMILYLIETFELSKNYSENSFAGGLKWNF